MKRISVLIAVIISLLLVAGCKAAEGTSESFKGYLSETLCATREEAAAEFVEEELGAGSLTRTFEGLETEGRLSGSEIAALPLGISPISVERGHVRYSEEGAEKRAALCIVETQEGFSYFAPPLNKGEPLTASYFRSVFENEAYRNCTADTSFSMRFDSINTVYRQKIMLSEQGASFFQDMPGLMNVDFFVKQEEDGLRVIVEDTLSNDGNYYDLGTLMGKYRGFDIIIKKGYETLSVSQLEELRELRDIIFSMNIDFSYFEKTDFGFGISSDHFKRLIEDQIKGAMSSIEEEVPEISEFEQVWENYKMYVAADYYVTEGRLSGMSMTMTACEGRNVFSLSVNTDYHSFGTTRIEFPEVKED